MGSLNPECENKQELDDSGYVQEGTPGEENLPDAYTGTTQLLDLSDDVLLYILRYCSPRDLKALGFTCPRLGALILDRTLWQRVDARAQPCGRHRVRWLLAHALSSHTTALLLSGYAREARGCLGFMSGSRGKETGDTKGSSGRETGDAKGGGDGPCTSAGTSNDTNSSPVRMPVPIPVLEDGPYRGPRLFRLSAQSLPRYGGGFPFWPETPPSTSQPRKGSKKSEPTASLCPGPQLTVTHTALRRLTELCSRLTELALDYCIIDCSTTNIGMFPMTLKKLSLRGTKCFNLEKSFLFKIQDHLTELEELDISYCDWVEPACMLPLSKMCRLRSLSMRECPKLAEFVAYASLATRYGFKALKILDLRGSPVGDSEVSALGWVPHLEQLYLSPAVNATRHADHAHYSADPWPKHRELEPWEEQEPEYLKSKYPVEEWLRDEQNVRANHSNYYSGGEDGSSCILLERMVAEPVAPDEYNQVYQQFIVGQNPNVPLANPDEYREAYQQYVLRSQRGAQANPPAGYIISNSGYSQRNFNLYPNLNNDSSSTKRKQENGDVEDTGPAKRQRDEASTSKDEASTSKDEASVSKENCDYSNEPSSSSEPVRNSKPSPSKNADSKCLSEDDDAITSCTKHDSDDKGSDDDDDEDDGKPAKRACRIAVNEGASTSKTAQDSTIIDESQPSTSACENPEASSTEEKPKTQRYIRFRQNQPPEIIEEFGSHINPVLSNNNNHNIYNNNDSEEPNKNKDDDNKNDDTPNRNLEVSNNPEANIAGPSNTTENNHADTPNAQSNEQRSQEAKHRILYVNVGRRRHAMYQLSMPVCTEPVDLRTNNINTRNISSLIYSSHLAPRLDHSSLVTDAAIRRFGRADGENISYVQIGPNGPMPAPFDDPHARPNRSNLRVLSVTGFRLITNLSLIHLATAAPNLELVDFTGTRVSELGVEHFKNIRPDCEVRYGPGEGDPKGDKGEKS